MQAVYRVTGMTCGGCARGVENAIKALAPQAQVSIEVATGAVTVSDADESQVQQAVEEAGFGFDGKIG